MSAIRLSTIRVEKVWGRHDLWPGFDNPAANAEPIGEIWFDAPPPVTADLMIKYLFTSERLSIQVHPNDAQGRAAGYRSGKEEAWVILAADPGATIALGTLVPLSPAQLRAAALDGSIETLMDWKPVRAGDVIYSPAGTVHAIGAGITLIEVQQNLDLTYRLYDYGRPRELHLDEAVAASIAVPFTIVPIPGEIEPGRIVLADSEKFVMERWGAQARALVPAADQMCWVVAVAGGGQIDGNRFEAGQCWLISDHADIVPDPASDLIVASPLRFGVHACVS